MRKRVVVAMSGGVDSSVAAALLKEQGFEVIGITMCFGAAAASPNLSKRPLCCSPESIEDARRVASMLGIRHYALNFARDLEKFVIKDFLDEYLSGRTPNPCIRCNRFLKFGTLLKKAHSLGASFIATGHYARIEYDRMIKAHILKKGKDPTKDQSYFLCSIDRDALPYILLPLGNYNKLQVRALAKKFGLPVHDKPGSQEICFVPDADYRGFLKNRLALMKTNIKPGPILDAAGRVLGSHKGIAFYTMGQRQGLGVSFKEPLYVIGIDADSNSITLGTKSEACFKGLVAQNLNFLYPIGNAKSLDLKVKIRYNQKDIKSRVNLPAVISKQNPRNLTAEVIFNKPQSCVAPGQSVVFYKADTVVGSGIIYEPR